MQLLSNWLSAYNTWYSSWTIVPRGPSLYGTRSDDELVWDRNNPVYHCNEHHMSGLVKSGISRWGVRGHSWRDVSRCQVFSDRAEQKSESCFVGKQLRTWHISSRPLTPHLEISDLTKPHIWCSLQWYTELFRFHALTWLVPADWSVWHANSWTVVYHVQRVHVCSWVIVRLSAI